MTLKISLTIDGKKLEAEQGQTILEVCRTAGIDIPTLCDFKGLVPVGACRLCLVEVEGTPKLLPACTTPVALNQVIKTDTERLKKCRRMIVELLFSERNHICAACVANNYCGLQNMGYRLGMESVRFPYLFPECDMDASHKKFIVDHNRCILCTRCIRVCGEIEGAHTWDVAGRGFKSRVISDFYQPWGESSTCTSCGKCVNICPTGALWHKNATQGSLVKEHERVCELIEKRKPKS